MGTVSEVPMAKPKPHTPVAAETERRRTDPDYFIDIIGRSGFQGGYCWTCQQPDGTWKVWRRGFGKPQLASHEKAGSAMAGSASCFSTTTKAVRVPTRMRATPRSRSRSR